VMASTEPDLGIPTPEELKTQLARDVFLQLAGMEALRGLSIDLQRAANDVSHARNAAVVERIGDALDLAELASGDEGVPISAVEERLPYAAVLITFHTAVALAGMARVLDDLARQRGRDLP
jgi:hypothetical protein